MLIPHDYKLTASELVRLLNRCRPHARVTEYHLGRRFETPVEVPQVIVTEAPEHTDLGEGNTRWDDLVTEHSEHEAPTFVPRRRDDIATIVYSSGTGGRPKGCMLAHESYRDQYHALTQFYEMEPGDVFFSILPTNHAIDFMSGFIAPMCCGGTVVHQRTLRPDHILNTLKNYKVTHMAAVPLILSAFEKAINERFDDQPSFVKTMFDVLGEVNLSLTRRRPNLGLSRKIMKPIHDAFGGRLKVIFCGGAFLDKERAEYFYRMGLPIAIGYGLTECCTVATLNDLKPFRGDSVGRPVPGVEVQIANPDREGIGQVLIRGRTVMKGYLDEPELTAETLIGGWLHTGDLGYLDASNPLHLVGRSKNMIVTSGGKNIYPEDIENVFEGVDCEELAVFATHYLFDNEALDNESLIMALRWESKTAKNRGRGADVIADVMTRNRRLADFKRIRGVLVCDEEVPRTASMKIKRQALATILREQCDVEDIEWF